MSKTNASREEYHYYQSISTRWIDNDVYGHVNNAVYYTYFDTVCNAFLIEKGDLDIANSPVIGLIVASSCEYISPIKFPSTVHAGMRVNSIGNSSVQYGVGIFSDNNKHVSAHGTFTHVFVDRVSGASTSIPSQIRAAFEDILK